MNWYTGFNQPEKGPQSTSWSIALLYPSINYRNNRYCHSNRIRGYVDGFSMEKHCQYSYDFLVARLVTSSLSYVRPMIAKVKSCILIKA